MHEYYNDIYLGVKMPLNIAIDGPAGAGKSTIARRCAKAIGFIYVDTGALYRAIAYHVISHGGSPCDVSVVKSMLEKLEVSIRFVDDEQRVFLGSEDVSDKIRTPELSLGASAVSAIPEVREFLFEQQREIARNNNIIMDGRDIGTVVLPNADLKIFLTASAQERATRRYDELIAKGQVVTYGEVLADVKLRDHNDSTRAIAPLKQAQDAILVDTTGNTLEQSIAHIESIIKEKLSV